MNRNDINFMLSEAMRLTQHRDYVIIDSLSALGTTATPPDSMAGSIDVDLYPKNDPGRAFEIGAPLGLGSEFEQRYGYYADAVSPMLPTLPDGWEQRLIKIDFENSVTAWFLEPNDAAISKYVRSEPRDREWIRAGLNLASCRYQLLNIVCAKPSWKLTNANAQIRPSKKTAKPLVIPKPELPT